jgi:exopolysaccharide biosynthesis polyprenyl glycosylphosphotransferase
MSFPAAFNPENSQGPPSSPLVPAKKLKLRSLTLDAAFATLHPGLDWSGPQRQAGKRVERRRGRNVLIVGAGPVGRELAATLEREHIAGRTVVGFLDEIETVAGDVLGRVQNLARIARVEFVDEIILAIPNQHELALQVIREARRNRLNIRAVPDLYGYGWDDNCGPERGRLGLEYFGDLPVLTLHEEKALTSGLFWKRVLDVLASAVALILAAPLMLAIGLIIKVTSPGQVLYQAKRVGLKGRRFICYKFRTMVSDADRLKDGLRADNERQGPCFKILADPRITRVGQVLRRYSLDELPQLWNVLRGEMSMVGPRPHPLDDFEHYRLEHLRRLDVTPGITGLWQITARRDPSFQRNMALDLEYIEHWTLGMDFWILWKTVFVILHGSGA